jgi:hypothetical protein
METVGTVHTAGESRATLTTAWARATAGMRRVTLRVCFESAVVEIGAG